MDQTAELLASMLRENTGKSMSDSGSLFGRHFERNRLVDFESEPPTTWSFSGGELSFAHHVYHWLKEKITFNLKLQEQFEAFSELQVDAEHWLPVMEAFVATMDEVGGLNGEGEPFVRNTYNGEDCLSQIIQYLYWSDVEGEHVLLQIHNGADIRGGYTAPQVFDLEDCSIMDNAQAFMFCSDDDCESAWSTDNAHTWTKEDGAEKDFGDYPVRVDEEDDERFLREGDVVRLLPMTSADPGGWEPADLSKEPGEYQLLEGVSVDKQTTYIPILARRVGGGMVTIYANKIAEVVRPAERSGITGTVVIEGRKGFCPDCGKGELQIRS